MTETPKPNTETAFATVSPVEGQLRREDDLYNARTVRSVRDIPDVLKALPQWVVWKYEPREGGGKPQKTPYQPNRRRASVTAKSTWCSFDNAIECYEKHERLNGIGFVLTPQAGIVGVDIDRCIDQYRQLTPQAQKIVELLKTYTEVSPSGEGLRLFALGQGLEFEGKRRGNLELYTDDRYLTITGNRLIMHPQTVNDRPDEIATLYERFIGDPKSDTGAPTPASTITKESKPSVVSDDEVLRRMFAGKQGHLYQGIYHGDLSDVEGQDESRADILLLNGLAWYTFKNPDQMRRIILASPWASQRLKKWQTMRGEETYLETRIAEAIRYTK